MSKTPFIIIHDSPDKEKDKIYCAGCSDNQYNTNPACIDGCWSYRAAHVVIGQFAEGAHTVLNCFHVKPLPKQVRPSLAKVKDFEMPLSSEKAEHLAQVLDFFMLTALRIEIFDAFLYAYRRGDNLTEALNFARSEWDV